MASFTRGRCLLKPIRKEKGLTQVELSRRTGYKKGSGIGYSPRMISFYERNERLMSPDAMLTISYILGVKVEDLYERILVVGSEE